MNIKKLEIIGFKSFANKTTIHFSEGITAIVGPNGCGKTNILDALRWVLGEQRVSLLRGSKMEEVIFNGTRDLKPLGMAEVVLNLVNNRGLLPTEYNEIQITRRLFRNGESEYLLNKVPCRLKDITELFYDTGMGAHSYSVIQQDMIEAVISDKAEERRFLFEEAAGITKYKQRKKAALRKLEATENDFLRLKDIYAEVQTQVRSLKRQQKKAERYQKVANDIKEWELYLNSRRINNISQEKREIKATKDTLTSQQTEKETLLSQLSSRLEADRKEQIDIEKELTRVGNDFYEISEKAHTFEKEISILKEKKSNATTLIERNQNDIKALKNRSQLLTEQKQETATELEIQKKELTKIETELKEAEIIQAATDQNLLAVKSTKEQDNKKLLELEGKLSSGKTKEENLRSQKDELSQSINSLKNQLVENLSSKKNLFTKQETQRELKDNIISRKQESEKKIEELTLQLEQLNVDNDNLTQELSELTASIEAYQARKNLLEDMIFQYDGYESGVKAAMEVKERWQGIFGTVAEKFIPVNGLEVAVESSLGEMATFLICDNRTTAESIIDFLKAENKGKIGILVPDTGTLNPVVKRPELDMPEFLGWMDSFVSTDDHLKPLMQAVLARTAVFESGYQPDEILKRLPYGFKAVSTTGDVFSKNIISGGSDDKFPLFRRKEKVAEQDKLIDDIQQQLSARKTDKSKLVAKTASTRADLASLSELLETLNEDLSSAQNNFNETEYQLRSLESEITRLEKEKRNLTHKLETIQSNQYTLGLDYSQLTSLRENLVHSIDQTTKQLDDQESAAVAALERVSKLQVKLVESKSRIEQTENKIKHLKELQLEITYTIDAKNKEIEQAKQDIAASAEKINHLESDLKLTFNQRNEITDRQNTLHNEQNDILIKVTEKEKHLKEARINKDSISENTHQLEIRLSTLDAESKSIFEKIKEEYETDIHTVDIDKPDENITEQQAPTHLQELKERLKKFGAVNLLALEEYRTSSEREQFLKEQLNDLTAAKNDLQATITKINQTARQLFLDTFDKVKVNFKNLFVELFSGGEADIILTEPDDPLESDIEIIARPRGKKFLSITMMSGGERALTAISMLFSLYLVKPSPFCILDEIDAPLDDANCHRFLKIIENFSKQTQFIIITHNKITMEASDNLYGVTMEQFGVSKLVAVKFIKDETDNIIADVDENIDIPIDEPVVSENVLEGVPQKVLDRLTPEVITPSIDDSNQE